MQKNSAIRKQIYAKTASTLSTVLYTEHFFNRLPIDYYIRPSLQETGEIWKKTGLKHGMNWTVVCQKSVALPHICAVLV